MALKATIFKAQIDISDMDRHYYDRHDLVIARHPSETDQRMMLRIIAFILNAHPSLTFTKGLSTREEPDLWQKSDSGDIELWIELGQPDEKRLRKASHQSQNVIIYTLNQRTFEPWWDSICKPIEKLGNVSVVCLDGDTLDQLCQVIDRNLEIQASIQDQQLWLSIGETHLELKPDMIRKAISE